MKFPRKTWMTIVLWAAVLPAAWAQSVEVKEAWVRATVPGQRATGAFMKLTAAQDMQLVGLVTSVAGVAELHEMKMEGSVMQMRAVTALALPAGKPVELKPGGYHVMLMDLKSTLKPGGVAPLTLVFKNPQGVESKLDVKLPVSAAAPGAAMPQGGAMQGHMH